MKQSLSPLPDLQTLRAGLTSVFSRNGAADGQLSILDRQPAIQASSFPSEIVTYRFGDGGERRLLCKYATGQCQSGHGHRGGLAYEIAVYREILQPLQTSTPRFYGAYSNTETGETWLILEYLDDSLWVNKSPDPCAMELAAEWIGQFHAANQVRLNSTPMAFLKTYGAEYYRGWVRRTSVFASHWHQRFPWLDTLCERAEDFIAPLLVPPQTVIHGEYYPENVLFHNGTIYPVDWESAAIAAGEIDLASLTEGWPAKTVRECERKYRRTRWPDGAPADFDRTLGAARLYTQFRWLGDEPAWTTDQSFLWRYEHLRSESERMGLI